MKKNTKNNIKHTHDDGTVHSHPNDNIYHEHGKKEVAKPATKKVAVVADKVVTKGTAKYSADYSLIDQTIDEIKKASRAVCSNHYATNNVYIILQDALKRVTLAEK